MILYHVVTIHQLLHCIIYKELLHKEQVCYILLSDSIKEKFPQIKEMEGLFFDKIFFLNTHELDTEKNNYAIEKYLMENKINPYEFTEIIVESPDSILGIYLIEKEINFTSLEDGRRYDRKNQLITKKIGNFNKRAIGFDEPNLEHFDLIESMGRMGRSFLDKVLVFFGINQKIQINKDSTILLTELLSNFMTFEEQKNIYQLMVDYFVPEPEIRLVIHPHPDDLMFYNGLFQQATVIKKEFPTELIPFIFNEKPKTVMTITSPRINNIMGHFKNCINFSIDFERYFNITHRYYCVVKLINELAADYEIYEMNSDKLLLENLLNCSGNQLCRSVISINNSSQIPHKSIVIIDDFNRDTFQESRDLSNFIKSIECESIIIFINSNKEYLFYDFPDKEVFESIVPVEINHNSTINEIEQYSEIFFVYSKRKDTRTMINQQEFEKSLRNSNELIKVKALSEDQLRIKILEGILEATEKRLKHYIKLESELREKLNTRPK